MGKVVEKSKEWLVFPTGRTIEEAKLEWVTHFNSPTAFAAIDSTYIFIVKSAKNGDDYVYTRTFCSVNVQSTCNECERFTLMHSGRVLFMMAECLKIVGLRGNE